jgi:capsular polysaccharide biosynthesis protein
MKKQTIFYLEGRGGKYVYHFFIYNLGGLYYIINQQYNERHTDSVLLNNFNNKIVKSPSTNINYPIKIHMTNVLPFQREAFSIIKDKFELVEDLDTIDGDYEIVSIYGALVHDDVNNKMYEYLRGLFLENLKENSGIIPKKRIFITRKNSEIQHDGVLKRNIINENELMTMLEKYNFEYVQLENLNTYEKIKLFMQSEIILSPHSGSLTFLLFANTKSKIIEILNNGTNGFSHYQYIKICTQLNLNYNRYQNIREDINGNFQINVNDFEKYLVSLL